VTTNKKKEHNAGNVIVRSSKKTQQNSRPDEEATSHHHHDGVLSGPWPRACALLLMVMAVDDHAVPTARFSSLPARSSKSDVVTVDTGYYLLRAWKTPSKHI
jgi:hypothetical protein